MFLRKNQQHPGNRAKNNVGVVMWRNRLTLGNRNFIAAGFTAIDTAIGHHLSGLVGLVKCTGIGLCQVIIVLEFRHVGRLAVPDCVSLIHKIG